MKIKNIKKGIISAFATGSVAVSSALTVYADGDSSGGNLSAVETNVTTGINSIMTTLSAIGFALVALILVVVGITLLVGGDKAKEKVKSHIAAIIIACVIIGGASVIATALKGLWSGS